MRKLQIATFTIMLVLTAGCGRTNPAATDGKPQVYTTFYPTTYFAERIAGEHVDVVCPLPADADPIHWMPPPDAINAYQRADLVLTGGPQLEKWIGRVTLPESRLVRTADGFRDRWLKYEGVITHSHGPAGEHSHEGVDPHVWLDPHLAKQQAAAIRDALIRLAPAHAEEFRTNYTALAADLDRLDGRLKDISARLGERALLASHPAYNYLAQRYGWKIENLDLDPAAMPGEPALNEIAERAKKAGAKILLWESPPREEIANRINTRAGLASIVFSPCETAGDNATDKDYLARMEENIARLAAAVAKDDGGK